MEGAGEIKFDGEGEHFFEEGPLGLFVEVGVVVVETDFADGN